MTDYWNALRNDIEASERRGATSMPDAAPVGMNVRYGIEFEWIQAEVRRMDADGPAAVDWSEVSALSLHILANQSKDILVACWAIYALFWTGGSPGLAAGLAFLRAMVYVHWEGLLPPIKYERARVGPIDWLVSRLGPEVAEKSPIETGYPAVLAAHEALDDLDRQLREKLVNEQVALGELSRVLKPHCEEAKRAIAMASERGAEIVESAEQARAIPGTSPEVAQSAAPDTIPLSLR
ncbi:putative component of type VI protein secretion system [Bradyrhizobium sp. USDA 4518]